MSQLVRPPRGRMLAGVCAAIAARFGWSALLVRLVFVVATVFLGLSLWVYIALWVLIPSER